MLMVKMIFILEELYPHVLHLPYCIIPAFSFSSVLKVIKNGIYSFPALDFFKGVLNSLIIAFFCMWIER